MSQFDFPRINFLGKTTINIATCDNDDFKPAYTETYCGLMVHDLVNLGAYQPPRVYVTQAVKDATPGYSYQLAGDSYYMGEDNDKKEIVVWTTYYYVEIEPVSDAKKFVTWAQVPMGNKPNLDEDYHPLYKAAALIGNIPGEWNYNGGMQNVIKDCSVVSVAVKPTDNSGNNLYTADKPGNCPKDLAKFLGASFNAMNDAGANTAVLCDLNPAAPYTTQYFAQSFYLRQKGSNTTLMAGAPVKGVTRWINFGRVVNIPGSPMRASGAVFQAIPAEKMAEWSTLKEAFETYGDRSRKLIGAFVRYDLFEVYEDRQPDYKKLPDFGTNPAYMSIMGSITPWYEGEMSTASMGRVLNPTSEVVTDVKKPLAPITFKVDSKDRLISLDLFNTLPETRDPAAGFKPYTNGNNPPTMTYKFYPLGPLSVKVGEKVLATIDVSDTASGFNLQALTDNGGMYDHIYDSSLPALDPDKYLVSLDGKNAAGETAKLMMEAQYVVTSDQNDAYANQGGPNNLFLSQGTSLAPVVLRVFEMGKPVSYPHTIPTNLQVFDLDAVFNLQYFDEKPILIYDQMEIEMDTAKPNIYLYVFAPRGYNKTTPLSFSGGTEYYINLRVLPDQSAQYAGYYLQPGQPGYKKLDWNALYEEIFKSYAMLYPAMTQQMPFDDAASWSEPFAASRLMQVINQNMWDQPWYMPRSRDLSDAQRKLINTWAQSIIDGKA